MIFKRAVAKLRAQDWWAISIELAIVIVGVFVGTWVANWNQERADARGVTSLIVQLRPRLETTIARDQAIRKYYATARHYAAIASKGWAGDKSVSDQDFVIAAYQASQVTTMAGNSEGYSTAIGADKVRNVADPKLGNAMIRVLFFNYSSLGTDTVQTDYRKHVRELLPDSIQRAVRDKCGDRDAGYWIELPPDCMIALDPLEVKRAAALLRSHPELMQDLNYHLAQTDTYQNNLGRFDKRVRDLISTIDRTSER